MKQTLDLIDFIAASPSSYHAAHMVAQRLAEHGFRRQDETAEWEAGPGGHYLIRGGAVMAWWVPEDATAFRIIGSHTDSPGFKLKPQPDFVNQGWQQIAAEVYGGPILRSWFDRELTIAGRVVLADGSEHLVNTGPVARIPNLAIHLDRDPAVERQAHTQMITDAPVMEILAGTLGVDAQDICAHDLITADAQRGAVFGDFLAAGRLDNLTSVHSSLTAFLNAIDSGDATDVLVLAAFDHEEVGSQTTTGAGGPILEDVLVRTAHALGHDHRRMIAGSSCVSADAAHAVHPNYAGKHDPAHRPLLNHGPVTKVNANQRYASDATTIALWQQRAGVPTQSFVSHNDVPCGSTIGPITATRLGIPTVDVGVPLLSMHSARELAGVKDLAWFTQALEAYLTGY
ncbi:M18 family aminopeptidase [Corynebacterium sp.]|uniref:M18 family aminopeptidase n=1 Tax=Corynebacterium sp. TaxID=1720 RepID=UPI003735D52F